MTRNISITLEDELINYIDDLAAINARTRSGMISYIVKMEYERDKALDEEAVDYGKKSNS